MKTPISVQMYTLKEETERDMLGTLEKLAEIGLDGVEFFTFGDIKASKMKETLDRLGLSASSSHIGLDLLKNNLDEIIEYSLEIGSKYIVCPYTRWESKAELMEFIKFSNSVGESCIKKGITFCYHNHAHEFEMLEGKHKLDIYFEQTDKNLVKAQIDTYWVQYAGLNPIEYLKKYSGRCPLLHVKDMEANEGKDFAEVGTGIIDFAKILTQAKVGGVEWLIIEQDVCKRPPLESISISLNNLKEIITRLNKQHR